MAEDEQDETGNIRGWQFQLCRSRSQAAKHKQTINYSKTTNTTGTFGFCLATRR